MSTFIANKSNFSFELRFSMCRANLKIQWSSEEPYGKCRMLCRVADLLVIYLLHIYMNSFSTKGISGVVLRIFRMKEFPFMWILDH